MSQLFRVHPTHPQPRLVRRALEILDGGGVLVHPTDSTYALACRIGQKDALERIKRLRGLDDRHNFTLACRDLRQLSEYARVSNTAFRLLKSCTPGPYTFIFEATKEVPKRLMHPKRRTVGIRVPDHPISELLLAEAGEPLMTTSLILPGAEHAMTDPDEIRERLEKLVDAILDGGPGGLEPTTVVDLSGAVPEVVRVGLGDPAPFA